MISEVRAAGNLKSFKPSTDFPSRKIILRKELLCSIPRTGPGGDENKQFYSYEWTENTLQIHARLTRWMKARLRAVGKNEQADYLQFLDRMASFGARYRPEKRDLIEGRSVLLAPLPEKGTSPWVENFLPLKEAVNGDWRSDEPLGLRFRRTKGLILDASYPNADSLFEPPSQELFAFFLEVLDGEAAEGRRYLQRIEQRGRRNEEVGRRLRLMKIQAERVNVNLIGLTFHEILKQIRNHLEAEEVRWFRAYYMPNHTLGGFILAFDPILHPLFQSEPRFRESVVRYFALEDKSFLADLINLMEAYLFTYPLYASEFLTRKRERYRSLRKKGRIQHPRRSDETDPQGGISSVEAKPGHEILVDLIPRAGLTLRQRQVIQLSSEDRTQAEIAKAVGISQPMVNRHIRNAMKRLKATSLASRKP